MWRLSISCFFLCIAANARAVTGDDIQTRYALIGVIAAEREENKSIVVLKDKTTNRSVTLSEGEALPNSVGWVIGAVFRRSVILSNGADKARVTYGGDVTDASAEDMSSFVEADAAPTKLAVQQDTPAVTRADYDNQNNVQYLDNLVSNREDLESLAEDGEDRSQSLDEYERHLEQELLRVRKQQGRESLDAEPTELGPSSDPSAQDPVFSDLPAGPTYFE